MIGGSRSSSFVLSFPAIPPMTEFTPTRAAALARLEAFLPNAGARYADERNADTGPGARANVSVLSPYVRHRLITEDEITRAVLGRFAFSTAEKFIQEVCWRTYWKGWLELRPRVWDDYTASVAALHAKLVGEGAAIDRPLRKRWQAAIDGNTGIACFDDWARELVATGYLHNHTRMWFASIWIFTLNLPWQLGADFFLRHLLDGDPASNTLSWRWVAGLQTIGKHYLARADNIQKYTRNRWWPKGELNEDATPLPPDAIPAAKPLPGLPAPKPGLRTALWLTEEDLCTETLPLSGLSPFVAIGGMESSAARSPWPVAEPVPAFTQAALDDGLARAAAHWQAPAQRVSPGERYRWFKDHGIEQLVTAYAPVGPAADALAALERELAASGIPVIRIRRDWDSAFWPSATKGFFQLRERIRPVLRELGLP